MRIEIFGDELRDWSANDLINDSQSFTYSLRTFSLIVILLDFSFDDFKYIAKNLTAKGEKAEEGKKRKKGKVKVVLTTRQRQPPENR